MLLPARSRSSIPFHSSRRHSQFSRHILDRSPRLDLLQRTDHLRFRAPTPRHTFFPFLSQESYSALFGKRDHVKASYEYADSCASRHCIPIANLNILGQSAVRIQRESTATVAQWADGRS